MIGVTNDEKVFIGSLEKKTIESAHGYTIEQKKKEKKTREYIDDFFSFVFRSIRKYWREEDIRLSFSSFSPSIEIISIISTKDFLLFFQ